MSHLRNDLGKRVIAVGAPGSVERARCDWPGLISRLDDAFDACQSRETALAMIRSHVEDGHEIHAILDASKFGKHES